MLNGATGAAGRVGQGVDLHEGEVSQRVQLEVGPEVLHGIERRGVGREANDLDMGMIGEEGRGGGGGVSVGIIPPQDGGAGKRTDSRRKRPT